MQAEVNEISKTEKFWRKKYIAILRWESTNMRVMMTRFPIIFNMYVMSRNIKVKICICRLSVNPWRRKLNTDVWFLISGSWLLQSSCKTEGGTIWEDSEKMFYSSFCLEKLNNIILYVLSYNIIILHYYYTWVFLT